MLQAGPLVGLDPAYLLPKDSDDLQALYQSGRALLQQRDLLRINTDGAIALEHRLRELFQTLIAPDLAVLLVKLLPGQGRQMVLFSVRGEEAVEHTLPVKNFHWLSALSGPGAVVERLHAWLPVSAAPYPPASTRVPAKLAAAVFGLAERVPHLGASDIVKAYPHTPTDLAARLALIFTDLTFGASLSFFRPTLSTTHPVQTLLIAQNVHGAWGITTANGGPEALIEHMNSAVLQATLFGLIGVAQTNPIRP
jgi:hypothetical protein